ncbi:MAG TPA: helix-turn-helix domain-containing protein [Candidatus Saccharimonadales bacterium]|nr:helix-turn-helix domain-containing protein [Candidatus Saccharimonadales bacterium]
MQQTQLPLDRPQANVQPRASIRRTNGHVLRPTPEDAATSVPTGGDADVRGGVYGAAEEAPLLLTVRDVEQQLQLGRTRTYELLRAGEIPAIRIGRVLRVPRDALLQWIDAHTT